MGSKYIWETDTTHVGLTFFDILTLIFITLKLTGVITWSWWWVLSPIWICWGLIIIIVLICFILRYFKIIKK